MEIVTANETEIATETEREKGTEAAIETVIETETATETESGIGIGIATEIIGMVDVMMRFPGKGITTEMTTRILAAKGDTKHTGLLVGFFGCSISSSSRFVKGKVGDTHRIMAMSFQTPRHLSFPAERFLISNRQSSLERRLPDALGDFRSSRGLLHRQLHGSFG